MILKSDQNRLLTVIFCFILLTAYSNQLQAQSSETEQPSVTESSDQNFTEDQSEQSGQDTQPSTQANIEDEEVESDKSDFDVDELVSRMKETKAIGTITKLSLKNQVDDLLEKAEEIKSSNGDASEEKNELRENFEGLILKTVTLLNKGEDYTLAEDIYLAREELWKSIMENKA